MKITLNNESLLDIRAKYPDCFYSKSDAWYKNQDFAKEKLTGTWEVSLEPVKDSFNKTWDKQQGLLTKGDEVPPIAVLVYAMCKHFKETGERVFEDTYVRTSSLDSGGYRVLVGYFDAKGLHIRSGWDSGRDGGLGLASARKLDTGSLESLETSESLTLDRAIAMVKEAGYQVAKIV